VSHLEVDPEELVTLGCQLEQARQELRGLGDRLRLGGDAAHESVVGALDQFADQWDYALQKISEHAGSVAQNLRASAAAYRQSEQEIARAAGG
jgi:uncharacterized protein YukE